MERYVIQIKSILKDKMSLLSFALPLILSILVNLLLSANLDFVTNIRFALYSETLYETFYDRLEMYGEVLICDTEEELLDLVKNVKDETIGIKINKDNSIISILAGDETALITSFAEELPEMLQKPSAVQYEKQEVTSAVVTFKNIFIVLVMVIATFIGCTFTAMNIISEKESGINNIYEIVPQKTNQLIFSKILVGYLISILLSILSMTICIDINNTSLEIFPLIFLGAYISSVTGLLIGTYSDNSMIGIVYIKMVMLLFIAVPLVFYLYFIQNNPFSSLLNIVPSYTFFIALIDAMEGIKISFSKYIIMFIQCIILTFWCFIKLGHKNVGKNT